MPLSRSQAKARRLPKANAREALRSAEEKANGQYSGSHEANMRGAPKLIRAKRYHKIDRSARLAQSDLDYKLAHSATASNERGMSIFGIEDHEVPWD